MKTSRIKVVGDKNCALQLVSDIAYFKKLVF